MIPGHQRGAVIHADLCNQRIGQLCLTIFSENLKRKNEGHIPVYDSMISQAQSGAGAQPLKARIILMKVISPAPQLSRLGFWWNSWDTILNSKSQLMNAEISKQAKELTTGNALKYRLIGWIVFLMLLFITQKAIAEEGFYPGGEVSYIPVQESLESIEGPESGTGLGLILGYQLTPSWAFQITLSRVFYNVKGFYAGTDITVDSNFHEFIVGLKYAF